MAQNAAQDTVRFESGKDPAAFLSQHGAVLERHAAEHNLLLTLCERAARDGTDIGIYTLRADGAPVMAAVQTPPRNLVISRGDTESAEALAVGLSRCGAEVPGIVAPGAVAESFTDAWTRLSGCGVAWRQDQIIYALDDVLMPPLAAGAFRPARAQDLETLADWAAAFERDALPPPEHATPEQTRARVEKMIAAGTLAVWEKDGAPVSMACATGTDSVARISLVYTPPQARGNGYAGSVVAQLSRAQIDAGKKICCLYADARNPVSNAIYRRIGYAFVARSSYHIYGPKRDLEN